MLKRPVQGTPLTRLKLPSLLMERLPRNENSRVETPEPRENIEHPTSNTERRSGRGFALPFDVRRWMFDVGCSSGFMGRLGAGAESSSGRSANYPWCELDFLPDQ